MNLKSSRVHHTGSSPRQRDSVKPRSFFTELKPAQMNTRMNPPFSPPLYLQRYQFVLEFVQKFLPRKVMDLGCSDCGLLRKLKFHRHCTEVLAGVDVDSAAIRQRVHALAPLSSDYLWPNPRPFTIALYQGSVTEREPCTLGFDLVTCIELIEHLELCHVERFSDVLFGYMTPRAVIVSTPNAEFNRLLPGLRGFRNNDHKFEWTRAEFQTWALGVCWKYGYSVEFTGVGEACQDREVGFCSQIGVFQRDVGEANAPINNNTQLEPTVYRLLYKVVYPSLCDPNIFQRTLVSEVLYRAESLKRKWMADTQGIQSDCISGQRGVPPGEAQVYRQGRWVYVPLESVWAGLGVQALCGDVQRLRQALLDDSRVQLDAGRDAVMIPEEEEAEEEDEEEGDVCVEWESALRPMEDDAEEDWETELGPGSLG